MTLPALHSVNAWAVTRTSVSRNTRNSPVFILCIYLSKGFLLNGETLKALTNLANVAASVREYWLICGGIDVLPLLIIQIEQNFSLRIYETFVSTFSDRN